jgi:hypothetical protein
VSVRTHDVLVPPVVLAFAGGLAVAFVLVGVAAGLYSRVRGEQCEGTIVNGLACVECHAPDRTTITCGVRP